MNSHVGHNCNLLKTIRSHLKVCVNGQTSWHPFLISLWVAFHVTLFWWSLLWPTNLRSLFSHLMHTSPSNDNLHFSSIFLTTLQVLGSLHCGRGFCWLGVIVNTIYGGSHMVTFFICLIFIFPFHICVCFVGLCFYSIIW